MTLDETPAIRAAMLWRQVKGNIEEYELEAVRWLRTSSRNTAPDRAFYDQCVERLRKAGANATADRVKRSAVSHYHLHPDENAHDAQSIEKRKELAFRRLAGGFDLYTPHVFQLLDDAILYAEEH